MLSRLSFTDVIQTTSPEPGGKLLALGSRREEGLMTARTMTIDFSKSLDVRQHRSGILREDKDAVDTRPIDSKGRLLTPKQIRARARRRMKRYDRMSTEEFDALYKPIEEWDLTELARGRPRNAAGKFAGPKPSWISREIHERAMQLFKEAIKTEMNAMTPSATSAILAMLRNEEVDEKGRPMVPYSTKLDAAKFLLEHTVGKPTQRVETDISVKLQAILGQVMVNPAQALTAGEYTVAHLPGVTLPMGVEDIEEGEIIDDE